MVTRKFFQNINIDCDISNVNEIKEKYNIVLDGVQVWTKEEVDGSTYDTIGILKGEKENYWLDIQDIRESENKNAILTRNSIYRSIKTSTKISQKYPKKNIQK